VAQFSEIAKIYWGAIKGVGAEIKTNWKRALTGAILGAVFFIGLTETIRWLDGRDSLLDYIGFSR